MPLVVLNTEIKNAWVIKGIKRKWPQVLRLSMFAIARRWMEVKFPSHFTPGNETRYSHERRNPFYKRVIKIFEGEGQGKYVDDLLKGRSRRQLWTSTTITATQHRSTIRMKAPAYFTDPYIGRIEKEIPVKNDPSRMRKIIINITRQPDKVRELLEVPAKDKDDLQQYLQKRMEVLANFAFFKP